MGLILVKKSGCDYIIRVAGGAILHRCKSARAAMLKAFKQWNGTGWRIIYILRTGQQVTIDDEYFNQYLRSDKLDNSGSVSGGDDHSGVDHCNAIKGNSKRPKK